MVGGLRSLSFCVAKLPLSLLEAGGEDMRLSHGVSLSHRQFCYFRVEAGRLRTASPDLQMLPSTTSSPWKTRLGCARGIVVNRRGAICRCRYIFLYFGRVGIKRDKIAEAAEWEFPLMG